MSPPLSHYLGKLRVLCLTRLLLVLLVAGVDEDEAMHTFQDKDILECEFYVVEALQFDLILHHPFPSLLQCVCVCMCVTTLATDENE